MSLPVLTCLRTLFASRLLLLALGLVALGAEARPSLSVQPRTAKPGDPVLVTVRGFSGPPTGTLNGRALRFFETRDTFQALIGLPVDQPVGSVEVKVVGPVPEGAPVELARTLEVVKSGFPDRELQVASKYIEPPESVKTRLEEDQAALAAAFSQSFSPMMFQRNFAWPRRNNKRITATFGDRRSFNGKLQSQHFGTDIAGSIGAPVYAANDGVVVMTRDNYSEGNSVLLHHGGSLYTTYYHLSKISVKQGAKVKQGQLLGRVGRTGRVTGPHLHWAAKIDGAWVNSKTLLELDFFSNP
jgi:murein DD-endopeptidase MepM/ murein hydrolase activator NlpD